MQNILRATLLVLVLAADASAPAASFRRVIGSGDPAPGVLGATLLYVGWPTFDSLGDIRLDGIIGGPGGGQANRLGFWTESAGSLNLNVLQNDPLPGGVNSEQIGFWYVTGDDHRWIKATLSGPNVDASNDIALIWMDAGAPRTVIRTGQSAPGMPAGATFHTLGYHLGINGTNISYFDARAVGPGINVDNDEGLWVDDGKNLRNVVREGDTPADSTSTIRKFLSAEVDGQGRAVFVAELDRFEPLQQPDTGIYIERNGRVEELLRSGIQAPGLPAGVQIESISYANVTPLGKVVFRAYLTGSGVEAANNEAIYADRGNGLELLARSGEPLPGLPDVERWSGGYQEPTDEVLLTVHSGRDEWQLTDSGWRRAAARPRYGDPAPGTSSTFDFITDTFENSFGRLAFQARLSDDVGQWTGQGIWAEDDTGSLQLVLRDGDLVETQAGKFEPVSMDDWDLVDFNDRGEVLLRANLDGAAGVYVAAPNPIPEPASIVLGIIATATLIGFGIRQRLRNARL